MGGASILPPLDGRPPIQRTRSGMDNAWNVQFLDAGVLRVKVFEGDSPKASGAVQFAKSLREHGTEVDIISRRRAFSPPAKQLQPPHPSMMWCPYCIKWREFEESIVVRDEYETPALLRCPTCLISIRDYHVRRYNPMLVARMEFEEEIRRTRVKKDKEKTYVRRRRAR